MKSLFHILISLTLAGSTSVASAASEVQANSRSVIPRLISPMTLQRARTLAFSMGLALPSLPTPAALRPLSTVVPAQTAVAYAARPAALSPTRELSALESAKDPSTGAFQHFDGGKNFETSPAEVPVPAAPAVAADGISFHGVALPGRAFSQTDRIPDSLVAAIDATQSTLRLALYELSLPGVTDSIVKAKARGVDVKLVFDQGHGAGAGAAQTGKPGAPSPQFQQLLDAGVETRLLKGGGGIGIMHNKFAVADGELVETGSFNWSTAADEKNFENALFRDDASLATLYTSFWDWMWGLAKPVGETAAPQDTGAAGSFGTPPSDPSPSLSYKGNAWPRASFSPQGGTEARLVDAIGRCERTLEIAIFSFYSSAVADAVAAAHARGVAVRVAADASQALHSPQVASLVSQGVELRLSSGRGGQGVLHHKFAIFDGEMLASGSFNFSQNAEKNNFENQLYSTNPADLSAYRTEFESVWAQAHVPASSEVQGQQTGPAAVLLVENPSVF